MAWPECRGVLATPLAHSGRANRPRSPVWHPAKNWPVGVERPRLSFKRRPKGAIVTIHFLSRRGARRPGGRGGCAAAGGDPRRTGVGPAGTAGAGDPCRTGGASFGERCGPPSPLPLSPEAEGRGDWSVAESCTVIYVADH